MRGSQPLKKRKSHLRLCHVSEALLVILSTYQLESSTPEIQAGLGWNSHFAQCGNPKSSHSLFSEARSISGPAVSS